MPSKVQSTTQSPGTCQSPKPFSWRNGSGYLVVTVNAPSGDWCNRWMWDHRRGFMWITTSGPGAKRYQEIFDSEQFLILQVEGVSR